MHEEKKIYIGNLDYNATEADVRNLLEENGITAQSVNLISDKYTGRAKGFGFVEFETEEQTQQAIDLLNGKSLNGRTLKVSKAQKRQPRRDNFGGGGGGGGRFNRDRGRRY